MIHSIVVFIVVSEMAGIYGTAQVNLHHAEFNISLSDQWLSNMTF